MLALRSLGRRAAALCRGLATLSEAHAAPSTRFGSAPPPLPILWDAPSLPAFPWSSAAAAVQQRQPASLSHGLAAAALLQQPAPAGGGLSAPQQGRQLVEFFADSVRRKRKRAMNKHKHRKRRKLNRMRK